MRRAGLLRCGAAFDPLFRWSKFPDLIDCVDTPSVVLSLKAGYATASFNREMTQMTKRTTHRSSKGTKLYAVRDKKGRFRDIQTYRRAHSADLRRKSKAEK